MPPTAAPSLEDVMAKISSKVTDDLASRLQAERDRPKPGTKSMFRAANDGTWERIDENPEEWWKSFANEAPGIDHIIDVKGPNEFELVTKADALERLETYTFGRGSILAPVEDPLNQATGRRLGNLPLGSIVIGGGLGLLASESVDAFFPPKNTDGTNNWANLGIKGGIAIGAPILIGTRFMSRTGMMIFSAVLLITAAQDFTPVDQWIQNAVNWLRGLFNGGTTTTANRLRQGNVQQMAQIQAAQRMRALNAGGGGMTMPTRQSPGQVHNPALEAF